jgi:hypothetical protein
MGVSRQSKIPCIASYGNPFTKRVIFTMFDSMEPFIGMSKCLKITITIQGTPMPGKCTINVENTPQLSDARACCRQWERQCTEVFGESGSGEEALFQGGLSSQESFFCEIAVGRTSRA